MTETPDRPYPLNVQTQTALGHVRIQDAFTQTDQRYGLVDAEFLNIWTIVLSETCADEPALYGYDSGKRWGESYYRFLEQHLPQQSGLRSPQDFLKDDVIEHLNSNFSYMGLGQFRLTEGNKFYTIELKNPFITEPRLTDGKQMVETLSGFFASLFSLFSGKELECVPVPPEAKETDIRFLLSTPAIAGELLDLILKKKSFREIAELYHNQHLL